LRARAFTVGGIAVLAAACAAVGLWFARPVKALRYAGASTSASQSAPISARAELSLQLDGAPPPERIELDLGRAGKLVVNRLP
jgi:hypothetical protein